MVRRYKMSIIKSKESNKQDKQRVVAFSCYNMKTK